MTDNEFPESSEPARDATEAPAPKAKPARAAPKRPPEAKDFVVALLKAEERADQIEILHKLRMDTASGAFAGPRAQTGLAAAVVKALQTLLDSLVSRSDTITPSSLRTVSQTFELIERLKTQQRYGSVKEPAQFRVLSVDDEAAISELIAKALATPPLVVETVSDPNRAVELAQERSWDLFILDVNMPQMSGFDLCAKLRSVRDAAKVPVIFLTGCVEFDDRLRFANSKANDFIAKPFSIPELTVKAMSQLLNRRLELAQATSGAPDLFKPFKV